MASNIIYHDFTNTFPKTVLTNTILTKGRRRLKALAGVNAALRAVCLFLNALCIGCSLLTICWIALLG